VTETIAELEQSAGSLAEAAAQMALDIETANYSILLMLVWTAEQLAEWGHAVGGGGGAGGAGAGAAGDLAGAAAAAAVGAGLGGDDGGINAAVQAIEFLKGDRTSPSVVDHGGCGSSVISRGG
jgi:hypothetical protein